MKKWLHKLGILNKITKKNDNGKIIKIFSLYFVKLLCNFYTVYFNFKCLGKIFISMSINTI